MTQEQNKKPKKTRFVGKAIFGVCVAAIGVLAYNHPLYLRPHTNTEITRSTNGVKIIQEEWGRFSSVLFKKLFVVNYKEKSINEQPELTIYVMNGLGGSSIMFVDYANDNLVDTVYADSGLYTRTENEDQFKEVVDPKFAEYKKHLNIEKVIANELNKPAPTLKDELK